MKQKMLIQVLFLVGVFLLLLGSFGMAQSQLDHFELTVSGYNHEISRENIKIFGFSGENREAFKIEIEPEIQYDPTLQINYIDVENLLAEEVDHVLLALNEMDYLVVETFDIEDLKKSVDIRTLTGHLAIENNSEIEMSQAHAAVYYSYDDDFFDIGFFRKEGASFHSLICSEGTYLIDIYGIQEEPATSYHVFSNPSYVSNCDVLFSVEMDKLQHSVLNSPQALRADNIHFFYVPNASSWNINSFYGALLPSDANQFDIYYPQDILDMKSSQPQLWIDYSYDSDEGRTLSYIFDIQESETEKAYNVGHAFSIVNQELDLQAQELYFTGELFQIIDEYGNVVEPMVSGAQEPLYTFKWKQSGQVIQENHIVYDDDQFYTPVSGAYTLEVIVDLGSNGYIDESFDVRIQ